MAVTRAEFGPTLPGALRERFGIPPVATLAVAAAIAVAAVTAILIALTGPTAPGEKVVHKGAPVFNMLHPEALPEAEPQAGELMRFEGRRGGLAVSVAVKPLELPRFDGDVTHGLLPVYADRFVEAEKRAMPGLELAQEGRARVNNGVGYEVDYERISSGERFIGRDVLLVPDDPEEGRGAVLLSLRQRKDSGEKLTPPERNLAYIARKAYRSFRFGTGRG